ncbi:acetyltransferase [Pseudomonas sp. N040]|uniref:acetyltransferase n=1 Tax=Pseudomonas sp. N040 TaxID=2785325 RepID=UPI0018A2FC41|nr:acetyltransferase [Pseudomonas sp. N040]MBF7729328.1 acetyltransferase [Pseudomonas sp. N040]MBW7012968.1 acetyltransferase [Pseudomonas sp. N040]
MKVAILGAGGHAKVICDAIDAIGEHTIIGLFDDNPELWGSTLLGCHPVLGVIDAWPQHAPEAVVIGVGDNTLRKMLFERLKAANAKILSVVHPKATLGQDVSLGEGTVIFAHAVVNCGSVVGANVILNTSSTVDHDCRIGAHAHLAGGVTVAGGVRIGEGVFLGTAATVIPNLTIGDWAIVGAGSVVVGDIREQATVVGVPARPIRGKTIDS